MNRITHAFLMLATSVVVLAKNLPIKPTKPKIDFNHISTLVDYSALVPMDQYNSDNTPGYRVLNCFECFEA